MKTLHRYLAREVLLALVMTVAVFTFVLLIGNVVKEVLTMLVNRQASLAMVAEAIALLIPFVVSYSLPMGMLTAVMLVFGRFSADQELTAARASGISLVSLITPILFLSLVMCVLSVVINLHVAPLCRATYMNLLHRLAVGMSEVLIPERQYVKSYKGYHFYVGSVDGGELKDFWAWQLDKDDKVIRIIRSSEASLTVTNNRIVLTLHDANIRSPRDDGVPMITEGIGYVHEISLDEIQKGERKLKLMEMTYAQLLEEKYELSAMGVDTTPIQYQVHSRIAFAVACFSFTLIGIPLAIKAHRRETNVNMGIALLLVALFYSFIVLGNSLDGRPEFWPQLIVWIPNFAFQIIGMVMLYRVNRGL